MNKKDLENKVLELEKRLEKAEESPLSDFAELAMKVYKYVLAFLLGFAVIYTFGFTL